MIILLQWHISNEIIIFLSSYKRNITCHKKFKWSKYNTLLISIILIDHCWMNNDLSAIALYIVDFLVCHQRVPPAKPYLTPSALIIFGPRPNGSFVCLPDYKSQAVLPNGSKEREVWGIGSILLTLVKI